MVHQHFMLIPVMTVAENVVLASEPRKGALLDRDAAEARVRELSERFGLVVDPRALVEDIGVGQQQRVEILRVLHRGADILILDEPTAVLTAQEIAELFKVLRALTAEGVSVIFITHKLGEVLEIADRVTVLRRGRKIDTVRRGRRDGGEPRQADGRPRRAVPRREGGGARPASRCSRWRTSRSLDDRGLPALRGLSLQVRAGEIVGIAGVDGNGQSELVEAITGLRVPSRGPHPRRRAATSPAPASAARSPPASATSPRTATAAASCWTSRSPRTSRCASTGGRRSAASGLLSPRRMRAQARPLLEQYDVRGGRAGDARGLAVGRQPAEGRDRARARRGPAGHDRRAADARARRRRDRVRPQAAARAARRGPRACCSSRSSSRRSARSPTACS